MTVPNEIPFITYIGNGVITDFVWFWYMLPESSIDVRLDNIDSTEHTVGVNVVTFPTAPAVGVEVLIFRRTPVHQPENYEFARGFKANKTELTIDREYMICQELESGGVGGADIYPELFINGITVHSERGTDAFLPLWEGDSASEPPPVELIDPGETIIWGGNQLNVSDTGVGDQIARIDFFGDHNLGIFGQTNARFNINSTLNYVGYVNFEPIADGDYWIRFKSAGAIQSLVIVNKQGTVKALDDEFFAVGAYATVSTAGLTPPFKQESTLSIEISKDLFGVPDGIWVPRIVKMTADELVNDPPPGNPVDITGAVSFESVFGKAITNGVFWDNLNVQIPTNGLSIWWTAPNTAAVKKLAWTAIEVPGSVRIRKGQIGQVVGDYTTEPTIIWGIGGSIDVGLNTAIHDIEAIPGEVYIFNIRFEDLATGLTVIQVHLT